MTGCHLLVVVLAFGPLAACSASDARLAADAIADDRWAEVESTLEVRRGLSRELTAVARARSTEQTLPALEALDQARQHAGGMPMTGDAFADQAKVAAWRKAQWDLADTRSRLAAALDTRDLQDGFTAADAAFARALQQYDAASRVYDAALLESRAGSMNRLTGKPFRPRVCFMTPP